MRNVVLGDFISIDLDFFGDVRSSFLRKDSEALGHVPGDFGPVFLL